MSSSWFIVLGELSVLFICLYWYLQHNHERKFAVVIEHDSIEGLTLGKVEELISRARFDWLTHRIVSCTPTTTQYCTTATIC